MAHPPRTHEDYQIGIICALAVEKAAMVAMLDETHARLRKEKGDENEYTLGRVGVHNVVIACLPAGLMGNGPAAIVANNMRRSFPIKFGLMVGVGGGVWSKKDDIRLGDVVVSQPTGAHGGVVQWDFGKTGKGGRFQRTGSLDKPPPVLLHALQELRTFDLTDGVGIEGSLSFMVQNKPRMGQTYRYQGADHDQLFEATYDHEGDETCDECDLKLIVQRPARGDSTPRIHYGNIASGNEVMIHGPTRDEIAKAEGVICFEMEAAGLIDNFRCLVIRGICDYADSHKNKIWQPYAAATASAFARALLGFIDEQELIKTPSGTRVFNTSYPEHNTARPLKPFSTVPFQPDPDFVDRPDITAWLREKCSTPAGRVALVGLGGVGKSQLAIQYAHEVRQRSPNTWVFWVHASTKGRFEEAYRSIADRLRLPWRHDPKINVLRLVSDWLCNEDNGRWVMILDNADDVEVFYPRPGHDRSTTVSGTTEQPLASFLTKSSNGWIVITSRSIDAAERLTGSHWNIFAIPVMDKDQAQQLLRNKLRDNYDEGVAADLLRALDYVPLAITQAAAYINRRAPRMSISAYLDEFRRNDKKKASLLDRDAGDLRRDESTSNSVATTWQITFEHIRRERRSAADLLSFMSFFHPEGIPESVLRSYNRDRGEGGEDDGDLDDEFEDDLEALREYSLVAVTRENDVCEMHALVQFCTRVWLSSFDDVGRWRRKSLEVISREFPSGEYENWTKCQKLDPHIDSIVKEEPKDEEEARNLAQLLANAGWYRSMKGSYRVAEEMLRKAVDVREKVLGKEHPLTLTSVHNLASVLRDEGSHEEAEQMNRRVVEARERVLGKEHPDTLASVNNLAFVLQNQGKYEEAEQMSRRALEAREKVLGKEHPDTLMSVLNLALVLRDEGSHEEAEKMNRQALKGSEKVLGKEHPRTLESVNSLVFILQHQGKYKEAEQMSRRALEGCEKVYGKENPSTLASVSNLVWVLQSGGKYAEAKQMSQRALQGYEKVFSKEHPSTLACACNYASVLRDEGKYEEAEQMSRRALEGYEKILGKEHPRTLTSVFSLAYSLHKQRQFKEAAELYERVCSAYTKFFGPSHPTTTNCTAQYSSLREEMAGQ